MAEFRILSLDGGGSWALIQVRALMDLYGGSTAGHEVIKHFDLIVANSGGSITLGGLLTNKTLDDILALFMNPQMRTSIFVTESFFDDPIAKTLRAFGIEFGPKYSAKKKLIGLRAVLGTTADRPMADFPALVGNNERGRQPQFVICGFDYDSNREAFFRSDGASLSGSFGPPLAISLVQAIHAASNAPVNYFDEPADGPSPHRYWDGAIGGYNNPVLAGVIEALANQARYNTTAREIAALSLGTGSVALPPFSSNEDSRLVAPRAHSNLMTDVKKLATSVLDDPPDAASFHAHMMLGAPLPQRGQAVGSPIVRMNPLMQPIPTSPAGPPWAPPSGYDAKSFYDITQVDMDAVTSADVDKVKTLCDLWLRNDVPNQPVRANHATLKPEIGYGRYAQAKAAWLSYAAHPAPAVPPLTP